MLARFRYRFGKLLLIIQIFMFSRTFFNKLWKTTFDMPVKNLKTMIMRIFIDTLHSEPEYKN